MDDEIIHSVPDEAELLLSRLLLSQDNFANSWSDMLMDGRYKGFQEMNHTWSIENIGKISDPQLKKDYLNIYNSYCKIVTYEETPVVEVDWERLKKYNTYFRDEIQLMIKLNAKIQEYAYHNGSNTFKNLTYDILLLEQSLKNRPYNYMTDQLNTTYNRLISELFYSIEGTHMDYWNEADSPLIKSLVRVSKDSPETMFGNLCIEFLNSVSDHKNSEDFFNIVSRTLAKYNAFGLQSSMSLQQVHEKTEHSSINLELLQCPYNTDTEAKVNAAILSEFKALREDLKWSNSSGLSLYESNYTHFASDKYFSTSLHASTTEADGKYTYLSKNLTFDLHTGDILKLKDLIGDTNNNFVPILIQHIQEKYIDTFPVLAELDQISDDIDYQISSYGLSLSFEPGDISTDYTLPIYLHLNYCDINDLFDPLTLYE